MEDLTMASPRACSCGVAGAVATESCGYCSSRTLMCSACLKLHHAACQEKQAYDLAVQAANTPGGATVLIVLQNRKRGWPER